ncbi:hypothetical protein AVEN_188716-1 [Araneus ventricosus]|uniref:STPR domain-containing protein n=1 Tax=Araneus ventricosus TaxID=182803 RepID=A0A4Y2D9I9_ARAVE|nr:hypothetical protein AVEN_188716-1 [Araneus ventricosus]
MSKRKRGVAGDAACRQQAIMKHERRVAATDKERNGRFSTMDKVARIEEQNRSLLTVMAQRGQKRRAEETEEQRNSRMSDMTQCGQERKAEETEEERNR